MTAKGHKIAWNTNWTNFQIFLDYNKVFCRKIVHQRLFIMGISPLSLSGAGSGFNVARNLSFDKNLAELCI